jgi:hypothetical protein
MRCDETMQTAKKGVSSEKQRYQNSAETETEFEKAP